MPGTITIPDFPVHYRIRRALEVAGLDPEQAAEKLGLHVNTLYNYTSGRRPPRKVALIAIAEVTRVPLWWLEGGSGGDGPITDATTRGYLRRMRRVAA